jgi:hypothetical protein
MSRWHSSLPSLYDVECPLPAGTQSWHLDFIRVAPVLGLSGRVASELTDAQRIEERRVELQRRLANARPSDLRPGSRR